MQLWHLTLAARTRHALFPDEALRLAALRKLASICGPALVLFCLVDDHLHWVVLCDDRRRGYIARSMRYAIQALTGVETKPVDVRPIHGRSHLETLRRYLLRQTVKHQLPAHPALWSGSAFPDLVGARWLPDLKLRLSDVLPRCSSADLFRDVGLPPRRLEPATDEALRGLGAKGLSSAAAAACGAPSQLRGTSQAVVAARRTACALGRKAGLPTKELAWALDIHPGSARKLHCSQPTPAAVAATRLRVSLEQHVAQNPSPPLEEARGGAHPPTHHR
jgi:hypothetical protein